MPPAAAVIVSRAKACARSARATPAGGCRRLLAVSWPLTGTITLQQSISEKHISLIVAAQARPSRHRPTGTTMMAVHVGFPTRAQPSGPSELVQGFHEH